MVFVFCKGSIVLYLEFIECFYRMDWWRGNDYW